MTRPGSRTKRTPSHRNPLGADIGLRTPRRPALLCSFVAVLFSLGSVVLYWTGLARVEMNPVLYEPKLDWWFLLLIGLPAALLAPMRVTLPHASIVILLGVLVAVQIGLLGYLLMWMVHGLLWRSR